LNDVSKHSRASEVFLTLEKTGEAVRFEIRDNGRGFSPGTSPRGLGLSSMKERAELSGGRLVVETAVGQGTRLTILWPLSSSASTG
jgi:signal transduction histidine kinase